jgi:predicted nucleic acid-binding protein
MLALARAEIFQARWSEDIHEEWMRALPERLPKITKENVQKIREHIDGTVPDCLVGNYRPLVAGLELPDPNDRHVLAAAIRCGAQVIVTCDTADFVQRIRRRTDDYSRCLVLLINALPSSLESASKI